MRKLFFILLAVLFLAVGAPNAQADSYTATFTCTTVCDSLPTASAVSFSSLVSVDVSFDGYSFVLSLPSGVAFNDSYSWYAENSVANPYTSSGGPHTLSFAIYDATTGTGANSTVDVPSSFALTNNSNAGALAFSPIATPEPRFLTLMLIGVGALLAFRKRAG